MHGHQQGVTYLQCVTLAQGVGSAVAPALGNFEGGLGGLDMVDGRLRIHRMTHWKTLPRRAKLAARRPGVGAGSTATGSALRNRPGGSVWMINLSRVNISMRRDVDEGTRAVQYQVEEPCSCLCAVLRSPCATCWPFPHPSADAALHLPRAQASGVCIRQMARRATRQAGSSFLCAGWRPRPRSAQAPADGRSARSTYVHASSCMLRPTTASLGLPGGDFPLDGAPIDPT